MGKSSEIGGCGFRRLGIDVSNDTAINTHAQMQTVNASQQQLVLQHEGSVFLFPFLTLSLALKNLFNYLQWELDRFSVLI